MTRTTLAYIAAAVLGTAPLAAQTAPAGWEWRPERGAPAQAADTTASFTQMPPGWHFTSGAPGLLLPADERASGAFSLAADFVVFPETSGSGFGILLGGADFDGAAETYLAALLRRDGSVSVIRRRNGADSVLVPWTRHAAIPAHPGTGTVTHRLRVRALRDSLRLVVNDSVVATAALGDAATDGRFGFRIGERVNLHVTILDYIRHLAPAR